MTTEEYLAEYKRLMHAIQTGIGMQISIDNSGADVNLDPNLRAHKHLRTGIDGSKADFGALARLLIAKGVITEQEYFEALLDGLRREKEMHESELSEHFGYKVRLI
jgi:hypothetical protein